jgi:hypothetical protein
LILLLLLSAFRDLLKLQGNLCTVGLELGDWLTQDADNPVRECLLVAFDIQP